MVWLGGRTLFPGECSFRKAEFPYRPMLGGHIWHLANIPRGIAPRVACGLFARGNAWRGPVVARGL